MAQNVYKLFPICIYTDDLNRDFADIEIDTILSFKDDTTTALNGNKFSRNVNVLDHPNLNNIKSYIQSCIDRYVFEIEKPKSDLKFYVSNSLVNYIEPGCSQHRHRHYNSYLSGVLYVKALTDVDKIFFYRDKTNMIDFEKSEYHDMNSDNWWIPVWTGRLVIFPSSLEHGVLINNEDYTRISLAFNIFIKGDIGNESTFNILRL